MRFPLLTGVDIQLLDSEISAQSQDLTLTRIYRYGANRLRVKIRSNSYEDQCDAVIEVWRDKWIEVARIASGQMETRHGLYYKRNDLKDVVAEFEADVNTLLTRAHLVIAVPAGDYTQTR